MCLKTNGHQNIITELQLIVQEISLRADLLSTARERAKAELVPLVPPWLSLAVESNVCTQANKRWDLPGKPEKDSHF